MPVDPRDRLARRLRLVVITDARLVGERDWLAVAEDAVTAGATCVQLRDKGATRGELLEMALALGPLVREHGALYIINDRFDVALAAGADGVHLGDDDLPVAAVRAVVPRDFIIGRSADTEVAARAAEDEGADYLGVGSVFGTRTKPEVIGEVIGVERLESVARAVSIPVVAIGGVTPANVDRLAGKGAAGVAVVSAVMSAPDPGAVVRQLLASVGGWR